MMTDTVFAGHVLASNLPVPFAGALNPPIADIRKGWVSSHRIPHSCLMHLYCNII